MQLRSGIAVAVVQAGSCSSNSPLSLGTSKCQSCSPPPKKKTKKQPQQKQKTTNKRTNELTWDLVFSNSVSFGFVFKQHGKSVNRVQQTFWGQSRHQTFHPHLESTECIAFPSPIFKIKVQLIYDAVPISAIQQNDPVIYKYIPFLILPVSPRCIAFLKHNTGLLTWN